ncbi:MAG TPA: aldo/keto reductase, partial [Phycisphaerae bacterium]|nr:aldo/keto reductase [Phycisphaerae bacterium]
LSGKYAGGKIPRGSRAASDKMGVFLREIDADLADRVDRLRPIAERHGMTLAQLAIAWLLPRRAVTSVIVGATRVEQVEENVAAAQFELTPQDLAQIDALFPAETNQ